MQSDHREVLHSGKANSGFATAIAVEAATGNITGGVWDVMSACKVLRLQLLVTVTLNYDTQTAEGKVSFYKRITYGSDTGRVLLGVVRLIHGTTAGQRLYVDIPPHKCLVGQQIVAAISTAGTGGGAIAGDFLPEVVVQDDYETAKNMPMMVAAS